MNHNYVYKCYYSYPCQLLTLESISRWGGVVDELEWAALVKQWGVGGAPEWGDDRPGYPISPLVNQVIIRSYSFTIWDK